MMDIGFDIYNWCLIYHIDMSKIDPVFDDFIDFDDGESNMVGSVGAANSKYSTCYVF